MPGRVTYLYALVPISGRLTPSVVDDAAATIVNAYQSRFGGETKYMGSQKHAGALPSGPDSFVVSTCLLLCKQQGIEFRNDRDTISYSVDQIHGEQIGTCRIEVRSGAEVVEPSSRGESPVGAFKAPATSGSAGSLQEVLRAWGMGCSGLGAFALVVAGGMAVFLKRPRTAGDLAIILQTAVIGVGSLLFGIASIWWRRYLRRTVDRARHS